MDKRYEQAENLEEKHKRQLGDSLGTEEKTFVLYISESGRRPGDYARVESGQAESLCRFFFGNQTYVTSSPIFRGADSSWVFAFALSRSVRAELLSWLFSISVWLSSSLLVLAWQNATASVNSLPLGYCIRQSILNGVIPPSVTHRSYSTPD